MIARPGLRPPGIADEASTAWTTAALGVSAPQNTIGVPVARSRTTTWQAMPETRSSSAKVIGELPVAAELPVVLILSRS